MKSPNCSSGMTTQKFILFFKRMALMLAIVFAVQGCAVFVRDRDDYRYRRHHWRNEHSSVQMNQFAGHADGKRMNANQNIPDSEHQKSV